MKAQTILFSVLALVACSVDPEVDEITREGDFEFEPTVDHDRSREATLISAATADTKPEFELALLDDLRDKGRCFSGAAEDLSGQFGGTADEYSGVHEVCLGVPLDAPLDLAAKQSTTTWTGCWQWWEEFAAEHNPCHQCGSGKKIVTIVKRQCLRDADDCSVHCGSWQYVDDFCTLCSYGV